MQHLKKSRSMISDSSRQKGATLIVVLVLLIAMTFLGLGGMSDSNLQLSMVRNSQMQTSAYTASLTEINAQLNAINSNAQGANDQIIVNLVNSTAASDGSRTLTGAVTPSSTAEFEILLDDVLDSTDYAAYQTNVSLVQPSEIGQALAGFALDDPTVTALPMQFISTASVNNTGAQSIQTQAFVYLAPGS